MSDPTPENAASPEAHRAAGALERGASLGRYLVLSLLGVGGMGEVYAAYDPQLDRRVALKLLRTAGGSSRSRKRLAREARALAKLSHPNVVQVHDVGEHEGDVFLAMELVEGQSLKDWCRGNSKTGLTIGAPGRLSAPSAPNPSWQAVLGAYVDAARGLAAAHQKGLVHRDIKPANILRGQDGRVRVADFGIAAGHELPADDASHDSVGSEGEAPLSADSAPLSPSLEVDLAERLTATGAVSGTPAFMAPEQYRRGPVGPLADQYSLCAALYEGLYGALPFTADADAAPLAVLLQFYQRKTQGQPAPPPPGTPVPAWVHRALVRGLAPRPEDRYPSIEALIAALSDDPDARRRARLRTVAVAALTLGLLGAALVGWVRSGAFRDPCAHPEQQLASVWDEGVKDRVRAAFLGTGRPYAEDTLARVVAQLSRYAGDWATMRTEVCEAYHDDEQSRDVLTLRDVCLDRRRGQLKALTTLFAERPDPVVLDKAVTAAAGLYPLAFCADTEALTARVRPPEDPALRARVEAVQPRVDRLEALRTAGKFEEGIALGEPLLAEVEAIAHPPVRAQVQYWLGRLREETGDYEDAKALLRDAIFTAAEGKDDVLAANAWAWMLLIVSERQRRFEEADALRAWGPAAVARAHDEQAQALWLNSEAVLLDDRGKFGEAKATHERALALREKTLGPDHPDVAQSLNNLAIVLWEMGDYPQAKAIHERALALYEKALGPDHPRVAASLYNLAIVLREMGDYPQAKAMNERALALYEKALGPDHHDVAYALTGLGRALVGLQELDAALPPLKRALALREKALGVAHPELADTLLGLAELHLARRQPAEAMPLLERALGLDDKTHRPDVQLALADALGSLRRDWPRARELAREARADYARYGHRPGLAKADRWLAEHPDDAAASAASAAAAAPPAP